MRLVGSREMQEMDRFTIQEIGIPGAVLMENAARGAARLFLEHFDPPEGASIGILCGRGNNGGDGYVVARYLHRAGMRPLVVVLSDPSRISGDGQLQLGIIRRLGIEIVEAPGPPEWAECAPRLSECDYLVDGILGTGLHAEVTGFYRQVIEEVDRMGKAVMAVDIPSGIHADTGQVMGAALRADLTVTFGFPKIGQYLSPGAGMVGRLARIDIGIPRAASDRLPARLRLTEPGDFKDLFGPEPREIHKGTRGHLLILAGSTGKSGAAVLAAMGALRAGAGLVTVGVPASLNPILEEKLTEAMTLPLPDTADGTLSLGAEEPIRIALRSKTALAIGPGLSTHPETVELVRRVVASARIPTLVDADGLNALAGAPDAVSSGPERILLTPHPGEMSRLASLPTAAIQADRVGAVSSFVERYGCFLVLKGAGTLIAEPGGEVWLNPTGNPALASGGTGDVLSGLISGLLARGCPVGKAAVAGVYLHGLAADLLSEEMGESGILAAELPGVVPRLIRALNTGEWPLEGLAPHWDLYQPL